MNVVAPVQKARRNPLLEAGLELMRSGIQDAGAESVVVRRDFGPSLSDYTLLLHNERTTITTYDMLYHTFFLAYFYTPIFPVPVNQLKAKATLNVEVWRNFPRERLYFGRHKFAKTKNYGAYFKQSQEESWQREIVAFYNGILQSIETSITESAWDEIRLDQARGRRAEFVREHPASLAAYCMQPSLRFDEFTHVRDNLSPSECMDLIMTLRQADPYGVVGESKIGAVIRSLLKELNSDWEPPAAPDPDEAPGSEDEFDPVAISVTP